MLSNGDRVLVAVSGGADSMALLCFLLSIKDKYSLDICVAHIEHGIRSNESKADADFVKNFCNKNNWEKVLKKFQEKKDINFLTRLSVIKLQRRIILRIILKLLFSDLREEQA